MKEEPSAKPVIFESNGGLPYAGPSVEFPYEELDGEAEFCEYRFGKYGQEIVSRLCGFLRSCRKPAMAVDQLLWVSGCFGTLDGDTRITTLAKRHKVSKQAFHQGAQALAKRFGLAPMRTMRDEESRKKMSMRNSRRGK